MIDSYNDEYYMYDVSVGISTFLSIIAVGNSAGLVSHLNSGHLSWDFPFPTELKINAFDQCVGSQCVIILLINILWLSICLVFILRCVIPF